jgi:catechol 2,3-dioxygenase-like lactoylglutathione lyase family enzyme
MPVIGLDHILIAIPEGTEPDARAFYCGLLGFIETPKPEALAGRGGLWLHAGNFVLHIGTEKDFVAPRRAHPGFLVDNLAAMIERLRAENVELTFDVPLPGYDRVHIRDPFGNRLELLQRLK